MATNLGTSPSVGSGRMPGAEVCYRAVKSRDRRFDGMFYTGVRSTGIYCRPSCPARTPAQSRVAFYPSAAAAQDAGFRACKRCLPDATPGSPQWDVAADVADRAMQLINDGVVDRDGVEGLAFRMGYSSRQLGRVLLAEFGAGPAALARAKRAQTARTLVETTELSMTDIAFAAGFSSLRQFNDTVREVYATTPTDLRGRRRRHPRTGELRLRLAVRTPFAGRALREFLAARTVAGVERIEGQDYLRTVRLPHGVGVLRLTLSDLAEGDVGFVPLALQLSDLRDTAAAVERARRLIDADCDPHAIGDFFTGDQVLGSLVGATPGLRVPGHVDGAEVAVRAVLGQQVSVAGARTVANRLTAAVGERLAEPVAGLTHLFPTPEALAAFAPDDLPMPGSRAAALRHMCEALAAGELLLDRSHGRDQVRDQMLAIPGIGPWTADCVALRALGHPDVFLPTDIGVRHGFERLGVERLKPAKVAEMAQAWEPWRSYALMYLWHGLNDQPTNRDAKEQERCGR